MVKTGALATSEAWWIYRAQAPRCIYRSGALSAALRCGCRQVASRSWSPARDLVRRPPLFIPTVIQNQEPAAEPAALSNGQTTLARQDSCGGRRSLDRFSLDRFSLDRFSLDRFSLDRFDRGRLLPIEQRSPLDESLQGLVAILPPSPLSPGHVLALPRPWQSSEPYTQQHESEARNRSTKRGYTLGFCEPSHHTRHSRGNFQNT